MVYISGHLDRIVFYDRIYYLHSLLFSHYFICYLHNIIQLDLCYHVTFVYNILIVLLWLILLFIASLHVFLFELSNIFGSYSV